MVKDNREYYDGFSKVYEKQRHHGYHKLIDELEFDVVRPYAMGRRVLDAGCGTGLLLEKAAGVAAEAVGVDISPGMLELAKRRGLEVFLSDITELPFDDESFDTVYSFKVLAHVERIEAALEEMARVTKPGGHLVLEFYNPRSLRGLIKRIKPATAVSGGTHDDEVFTRFDRLPDILSHLPGELEFIDTRGVRIATPFAFIHRIPLLGSLVGFAERKLVASPLRGLAGFLIVVLRKR